MWEIDIPMLLNYIFVLTGEDISCELMKEVIESSRYFQPDPRYSGNNEGAIYSGNIALRFSTAEHRAETVKISLIRGILKVLRGGSLKDQMLRNATEPGE